MVHYGLELQSNTPCEHKSATRVAYTYLKAARRQVHVPQPVVLGSSDPDLSQPDSIISNIQKKLPEASRDKILAVALFKDCDKHPLKTLTRLGGIAIATPNRFIVPVMNPLPSHINQWGVTSLALRDPASSPEAPRPLKGSAALSPAVILPVHSTLYDRHPVTDAIEADHTIYIGLHGVMTVGEESPYMEMVVDKSILNQHK